MHGATMKPPVSIQGGTRALARAGPVRPLSIARTTPPRPLPLAAEELSSVLRALGALPGPREVRRMMDEMDSDRDGFVDLAEFVAFHCSNGEEEGREDATAAKLREAFRIYNADRNGLNSARELRRVLRQLGRAAGCAHRSAGRQAALAVCAG
ncbi:probable calcium-binding protein CML18 [Miscanthus floridulus]|uniref:probable calcium-binding protein CML18 n=1 Tax=Miscanthus floridulus TaxID=154761 RepID=UPI00345B17A0